MKTRQTKATGKKVRSFKLRWLVVFLVVCSLSFGSQVVNIWNMKQEIKSLNAKKQQLARENKRYQADLRAARSDEMLEKLAREELGMIKPGEKVLIEVLPQD